MADAGFLVCGPADRVRCYYCGCVVEAWQDGNDPWREHARMSPTCGHVVARKGAEYVRRVFDSLHVGRQATGGASGPPELNDLNITRSGLENVPRYRFDQWSSSRRDDAQNNPPAAQTLVARDVGVPSVEPTQNMAAKKPSERPYGDLRIDPTHLQSRLEGDDCRRLQAMGYPKKVIEQVMAEKLAIDRREFDDFESLRRAVHDAHHLIQTVLRGKSNAPHDDVTPMAAARSSTPQERRSSRQGAVENAGVRDIFRRSSIWDDVPTESPRARDIFTRGDTVRAQSLQTRKLPSYEPREVQSMDSNRSTHLYRKKICKVCAFRPIDVALDPCRHTAVCHVCVDQVTSCPICLQPPTGFSFSSL